MRAPIVTAASIDFPSIRGQVDAVLAEFVDAKARSSAAQCFPAEITEVLRGFLFAGGKRLRPMLCVLGWHTAGDDGTPPEAVVRAAASLEMFHAFALLHDDVMDDSASRRGRPTAHRTLAAHHGGRPDAERLGINSAILLGDLALAWSDELLHTAGLATAQLDAAHQVVDAMRTELMYGQYLDLCATGQPSDDVEAALTVARYKTARYTVERPLHLGAALAGADRGSQAALSSYALPLGEAFQLRDDLLGVFGDPTTTGKPCLDDLRAAKHTALTALALRNATPAQAAVLKSLLGDPDLDTAEAGRLREVLVATGARREVEHMIRARRARAVSALTQGAFPPTLTSALRRIAGAATVRTA
ncbi:polyprenyl synthetase family protein [Streptomyces sp. NPDC001415]